MGYVIPDFAAIRSRMLRDAANLDPTAPQDGDSDLFIRSSVTASAVAGLYDFLAWQARQLLPDTADPEYLEQHCALRGLTRKPATRATGTLALTGRDGAAVPVGTQCRDAAGILYQTTESAVLSGGEEGAARAACEAVTAGALPDVDDAPVTLLSAPSGVLSSARLTLAGGSLRAQNMPVVTAHIEPDSIMIGDRFDYVIDVENPSNALAALLVVLAIDAEKCSRD